VDPEKILLPGPAARFGEAFPLGNGRLGAMAFAGTGEERILLSENTFFSGGPSEGNNRPGAPESFRRMGELLGENRHGEAAREAENFIGIRGNYGTNLPLGDLSITDGSPGEPVSGYSRELDLREGVALCSYLSGHVRVERTSFLTAGENLLVHRIRTSAPRDYSIRFRSYSTRWGVLPEKGGFSLFTKAVENLHSDGREGVTFFGLVKVLTDGTYDPDSGRITGARETFLCLTGCTDFSGGAEDFLLKKARCRTLLAETTVDRISLWEASHRRASEELFSRCTLELEGEGERELARLFHLGRYLLYSSSRPGSELPAHLQGVWNDNVACRIGWTCDMHLDINTQMNYWPGETTGLSEVNEPLFAWMENYLVPRGRKAARESYGLPGWTAEIVSNAWGFASPYWAAPIAPSPGCGIWILTHLWEHFLYTEDRDFLEKRAYPLMEEGVRFFTEYLRKGEDGLYRGGPSISPENSFLVDGVIRFMSLGDSFDTLMIRELFTEYEEASRLVDGALVDGALREKARVQLDSLLPYRILPEGTLAEWDHDYPPADRQHRHTSHLLGLYPFDQISREKTPELAEAALKTMEAKLTPAENWEDTGWARSMMILYCARLGEGDRALEHIRAMTGTLLEPNGMIIHPPTRGAPSFDNVYEMDGNTGLLAGMVEMLLQSQGGKIRLLPALPGAWKKGRVTGLKARGGLSLTLAWEDSLLTEALIEGRGDRMVRLVYRGKERVLGFRDEARVTGDWFGEG